MKNKDFEIPEYCFRCGSYELEKKGEWNYCKNCGALSKIENNELNIKIKIE